MEGLWGEKAGWLGRTDGLCLLLPFRPDGGVEAESLGAGAS